MTVMYLILAVLSIVYLVVAAFMDLKERMIFVFPMQLFYSGGYAGGDYVAENTK